MKINRFVALAALALLIVGAMGAVSARTFAQGSQPPAQSQDCAADQNSGGAEAQSTGPDTDNVELQCGDQSAADGSEVNGAKTENGADGQEAAVTGTPFITAEAAQKTAEAHLTAGAATKVELDDENSKLVYSVEFSNGADVKVDAMTGAVLGVETGQD